MRGVSAATMLAALLVVGLPGCTLVGSSADPAPPWPNAGAPGAGEEPEPDERPPAEPDRRPVYAPPEPERRPLPGRSEEVRALWVVRTTLSRPDSVRAMVRRADEAGFNTLLVQVRGRGDAYYRSQWEPPASALADEPADYDPLALTIREAHARGLAVHAWVNAHLVAGVGELPDDPRHLVRSRPDLLAVPRPLARRLFDMDPAEPAYARALLEYARENREQVEGLYTSPAHPAVSEHLYTVWMDLLARYEVDGLHLDYVRYPSDDFDYSRAALERFRRWASPRLSPGRRTELERAYRTDPLAYVEALPGPWSEFRRSRTTELVRRTYYGVRNRRPDVVVSAAVRADAEDAWRHRFQDWRGWLAEGILDAAAPMAYVSADDDFRALIEDAVREVGGERIWAGIGVYRTTFRGTVRKISIARELGVGGVSLFSYDWAVARGESDRPLHPFLRRVGEEAFGARR